MRRWDWPCSAWRYAALGGGELAQACTDPAFRAELNDLLDLFPIDISTVGECVSAVQTLFNNETHASRYVTLLCESQEALATLGTRGRCVAALTAELKR